QDEFLEVQRQVAKTICFVTHDLAEAVKLGDRIAVFGPGGRLAQYDTPGEVLTHPADDFVAEFVGSGAAVRRLSLLTLDRLELEEVAGCNGDAPTVPLSGTVYDAVDVMLDARAPLVVVVDDAGRPRGVLRWETLVSGLRTTGQRT
ncbi:MAG TPA: ABC transporter, partial [Pseudonocardiaceae bacterium]|nr:ABC transporter [Pseudonocardiaceae bacterium]